MLTMQLKLSELVLAMKGAENRFAAIEDMSDEELQELHESCKRRAEQTFTHIEQRRQRQTKNGAAKNGSSGQKPRAASARAKSHRKSATADS
jgi:low affinity Fe/Cu permease